MSAWDKVEEHMSAIGVHGGLLSALIHIARAEDAERLKQVTEERDAAIRLHDNECRHSMALAERLGRDVATGEASFLSGLAARIEAALVERQTAIEQDWNALKDASLTDPFLYRCVHRAKTMPREHSLIIAALELSRVREELTAKLVSLVASAKPVERCRFRDGRCLVCGEPESGMCNTPPDEEKP